MQRLPTVFVFVVLASQAALAFTPVRKCPSGVDLPESVRIQDCTSLPCWLQNGAKIDAIGEGIVSPVTTSTMTTYMTIFFAGLSIDFPPPDGWDDACAKGTAPGTCPVQQGDRFDYHLEHPGVTLPLAGVNAIIEVGIRADDGSHVTCLQFDAFIHN
ncbi:uncharacterized protein LOC129750500 [Uranotaenia lowii]|uniref:uncharacterized protein LOC129750500 n=1 Tax=Uranotaenia lowii TaxID=190385 RepID=UPI0024784BB5|nr:uncharacterized protein LOC129750500 [Uranotaenia lowii]